METDHVRIEVHPATKAAIEADHQASKVNPPLKVKPPKSMPTGGKFRFVPKQMPHLQNFVKSVKWSSSSKKVRLEIAETPMFDVYKWIEYIDERQKEIQKGPFVNLNEDAIMIHFLDANDQENARLKLINISLESHSCKLDSEIDSVDRPLRHRMILSYQDEVMTLPAPEEKESDQFNNSLADEEWASVEVGD